MKKPIISLPIILMVVSNISLMIELFREYGVELAIYGSFGLLTFIFLASMSKHYIFPEVYTRDEGGRDVNYLGRKLRFKKSKRDSLDGVLIILNRGWFSMDTTKIAIPDDIEMEKINSSKMAIHARNIKYDYVKYKSFIPTNQEFKAIHPDEKVFNDEIKSKLDITNNEVRKATNANAEVSKWQKTSGSIPLSAQSEVNMGQLNRKLKGIGHFGEEKSEKSMDDEDEESKESYTKEDARNELNNILGGDMDGS